MTPQQIVAKVFGSAFSYVRGYYGGSSVNSDGHHGWDITAKLGTPIPALAGGRVVYAEFAGGGGPGYVHGYRAPDNAARASSFWTKGGGNTVVIEAADGTRYQYAHLQSFNVKVGDTVSPGQFIGKMGDTGDATGSHLHFAMTKAGSWINPTAFLSSVNLQGFNVGDDLPGFNFLVSFPVGHRLTESDINRIIDTMNAHGWFNPNSGSPIADEIGQVKARNAVADTLKKFVGREWSPTLLFEMSEAIGFKAETVDDNPLEGLADIAATLGSVVTALFNPMTYVNTGALLIGLYLAFKGFRWIAEGSGNTTQVG